MGPALIVFKQTVVMFLYMFAGFVLYRTEKITVKGSKDIANILVWLVIPAVIVNSFCAEFSEVKLLQFLVSTLLGALSIAIAMLVSALIFKKDPIANFACSFSNAGFIGIPLIQAAFGDEGVFWMVGIVAMMNIMQWSYGVSIITGKRSAAGIKNIIKSPIMAGTAIGLMIFLTGFGTAFPLLNTALSGISSLNAPVAMIVLGTYLAQSDIKKMITSLQLYKICAVRLVIIPLITLLIFKAMTFFDSDVMMAIFIAACTPAGANVAVYAQLHDRDYPYACQTVTITTLLSIVTLPLMILLADSFLF